MQGRNKMPPRVFLRFFRWYCHPKLANHIEGDLMEVYNERIAVLGKQKADRKFIVDVLLLFRPGIIKPMEGYRSLNTYGMYKSYLKIGWRNLLKSKGYSLINIGGLAVGMAVAMSIGLWIYDELQFNKYHSNYSSIARVMCHRTQNGETMTHTMLPYALGDELNTKYGSTFKDVVMMWVKGSHVISTESKDALLTGQFIGAAGPDMFTFKMLRGSAAGWNDPHSILLSATAAKIFFGEENPIGKLLKIGHNDRMDVKVTGVYEDLPYNSFLHGLQFFAPLDLYVASNEWMTSQDFTNNFIDIYVRTEDGISMAAASEQIKNSILDNVEKNSGYAAFHPQPFLHPMDKWRLYSEWKNGVNTGGLIDTVWLFGVVGVFVLALACINFMNLNTARYEKRAKEVGIRKSIGSVRRQLINQFFTESFLVVALAFVVAILIVSGALPWFNVLASKQMVIPWLNAYFWMSSFVFILITGFLAGSYPALYLSSFDPVSVLKGTIRVGRFASLPRKVLVVVQFTVSVTLIIGTIIVYQQIQFAKNRPVGYTRDGLLMMQKTSPDFGGKYETLRNELKNTGVVLEIAESSSPLTDVWTINGGFDWVGRDPSFTPEWATVTVTPEYGKTVGWTFLAGRDFSRDMATDSAAFVINEAAAKLLGFENPVGETLRWQGGWRSKYNSFTVIGVIKDMVMTSPYARSMPAVYFLGPYGTNWVNIRVNPTSSVSEALPKIEAVFKKIIPSVPFDYKFADQEYALKFVAEERVGKLASVFAALAMLISCLGLFGLASFVTEQRTKEIGIRKVVGASIFHLWKMLSKDFLLLVVIACLIAVPLAAYFLAGWLQQYEYRTEMTAWVFIGTTLAAVIITLLTVSYQALRAALMNPVKSLRSE